MEFTINTRCSSREEVDQLRDYLIDNCWDFKEKPKALQIEYILKEDSILVVGSQLVVINPIIYNKELFEYVIIYREDLISDLFRWISGASKDKVLMRQDLELLMSIKDDYIFSSISTNQYQYIGSSQFNETCELLLELNKTLTNGKES